jgi:hypothetical protein
LSKITSPSHKIAEISFSADYVLCTCGFEGVVGDFEAHRLEMGQVAKRGLSAMRAIPDHPGENWPAKLK